MSSGKKITIRIPYTPQEYQQEIHSDPTRYKVLNIGRRGGKTELVLNELLRCAIGTPGLFWYVAPSYRQAKSIAWVRLKVLLAEAKTFWKFNEQELYAEHLPTSARIELKGADNEESLLGVGLKGVVFDETARIKESVWLQIVRPMLADSKGWAIFISTPKGKNWFFDLYMRGAEKREDWKSWKYPTRVNEYISAEEIASLKRDMSERMFSQEIEAEFLDDETGVFKRLRTCIAGEYKPAVPGRFYTIGVDLAKTQDFTVLTVLDSVTREVVAFERFQHVSWREQKIRIQELSRKYNNALCIVDSSGLGDPIYEDLVSAHVPCDSFKFTNDTKCKLVEQLAIAIEQRLITFPHNEIQLRELEEFEYVITDGGRIKYGAPEGKHDDCVISLALAVWGIRSQLKESQVIQENEIILSAQDRQGLGDALDPEYELSEYGGY